MLVNNTIESSRRPGIPGPHRPDLKWFKDALDSKSDVGHVHKKKDITDFEHTHDGRYYRKDEHELQLLLSGNGTPNFNQGINGDYYVDELNGDLYKKSGDAWNLIIHLEGEQGIPGPQGNPGIRGPEGPTGKEGYTPVRGTDYWTSEDEEIIRQSIVSEVQLGLSGKVDKVEGKGLSTEDFTTLLKQKLEELQNYDDRDIRELLEKALYNVTIDVKTGILTFHTIDESTFTVDLPLELIVSDGYLNKDTNTIVLVLANGNTIDIPVENLIKDFYSKSEVDQKIDNLAEEVALDFETVDEKLSKAQAQIDTLKAENEAQQKELDILYNDLVPGEASGETVAISDGLDKSKIKADINGNSKQETTEGYNLLDENAILKSTGVNIENGEVEANSYYMTTDFISIIPLQEYTLSWKTENNYVGLRIAFYNSNKEFISGNTIASGYYLKHTFESVENAGFVRISILKKVNDVEVERKEIQLVKGTEDKPYEPYTNGASPNTEYKQDIEVIDGVNEIETFAVAPNAQNFNSKYGTIKKLGIEYTWNEDNTITVKGTATDLSEILLLNTTDCEKFEKGINYRLSGCPSGGSITKYRLAFASHGVYDYSNQEDFGKGTNVVFKEGEKYSLRLTVYKGQTVDLIFKPMFTKGTEDKPYLPYGHIGLVQRGKSLVDFSKPQGTNEIEKYSFENDTLSITSRNGGYPFVRWEILDLIKRNAGKTLFINFKDIDFIKENISLIQLAITNNNVKSYSQLITIYGEKRTYTIPEDVSGITQCTLQLMLNNSATSKVVTINITEPILSFERNDTYEPYIEPIVHSIDLAGNSLAKIKNTDIKDNLLIGIDGSCEIKGKIANIVLDGVNYGAGFTFDNGRGNIYNLITGKVLENAKKVSDWAKVYNNAMCSHLKYQTSAGAQNNNLSGIGTAPNGTVFFKFDNATAETNTWTKETKNEFLKENNMNVYYELEEPTTIPLPSIEPITLFEGTNVFELVTNLGTTMAVTYKVSNKKQIIENNNRITALEATVNTLLGGN